MQQVVPSTDMLILQPTGFCNIDCRYCYLPGRNERARMSGAVLDAVFSKVLPSSLMGSRLAVVWHAGEPLSLPCSWYAAAFDLAERHRPPKLAVDHVFQSNGMMVNRSWVTFLRETSARISLSLDGPDWLHDRNRRTRNDVGTHRQTMRGLRLLQEAGMTPPVISVLTAETLQHADAMFDFYRDHGIRDVAFNVEELEGAHGSSSMAGAAVETAYRKFLRRFLERMHDDPEALDLREWRDGTASLRLGVLDGFNQEAEPMRIVSIAVDGAMSTFSPEFLGMEDERYSNFVFGNILEDSMEQLTERVLASAVHRDIRVGVANCRRSCGWFDWCGGGSPSNKFFETGYLGSTETAYCRLTRQAVLEVVLTALEQRNRSSALGTA